MKCIQRRNSQFTVTQHSINIPLFIFQLCMAFSLMRVNLLDYMDRSKYEDKWRYRITELNTYFLDESGKVIPNNGADIYVKYPVLFFDTDMNKKVHAFNSNQFKCITSYRANGNQWQPVDKCSVSDEFQFNKNRFSPSPNGTFTFELRDRKKALDLSKFQKLRIDITGSYVAF